jgi:transcriptional regulator with XRE-family HTH domain
MRIRGQQLSSDDWERQLGTQFRALRISADLDQAGLASLAGVSVGALRHLERGEGSTLRTLVRVVRALDREDWLESIAPRVSISPIDLVRSGRTARSRVARSRVYRPRGEES